MRHPSMLFRRHSNESRGRGQALVEFAAVLPLLLLILLMAVDFGRVFFGWVGLQNAARIGSNYAAQYADADWSNSSDPKRQDYIERISDDAASINCDLPVASLPMPSFPGGTDVGQDAVVTLTCPFHLLTPFMEGVMGGPITLSATSTFPIRTGIVGTGSGGPAPPPPPACVEVPALDDLTVAAAREAWATGGFTGVFFPSTTAGQDAELVVSQYPLAGDCVDTTSTMTVDSDPDTTACDSGELRVPKLIGLSMQTAEATWTADFDGFLPAVTNSNKGKTVDSQVTSPSFSVGACAPESTDVTVTWTNGQLKCDVPNFIGSHTTGAQSTWSAAGFDTIVAFLPGAPYTINQQSLVSGSEVKCDESVTLGP